MKDRYIDKIRRIIINGLSEYPVRIYLFGSRVSGTPSQSSDCDVGLDFKGEIPPGVLSAVREELEESHVPYRVELVDLSETSPDFTKKVREEGIPWYNSMSD